MKTLIVMPAHNEAPTIGAVLARLRAVVPDADILVINDASTDETAKVAEQAGATVLNLPINLGYGGAVQTGFKYASRKGYEAVVLMDADGQHDPECVPDLLKALQEADFVLGSRFLGDCRYKVPLSRRIGMWLFGTVVRLATQLPITDPTSGFQALRREQKPCSPLGHFGAFVRWSGSYPTNQLTVRQEPNLPKMVRHFRD